MRLFKAFIVLGQCIVWTGATTTCAADSCASAVTATTNGVIFQSVAKKDCSSFLQATVYPSTVTSTGYTTIFPSTSTRTITTLIVSETATVFPFTDNVLTTVTTASETVVSVVLSTVTITTTETSVPVSFVKRTVTPANIYPTPGTSIPTAIPTYASACGGVIRYSSVCSCLGITKTTITLPAPTASTVITTTEVATVIQNVAFTITQTISLTTTIFSNVVATVTVTSTSSSITTTIVTATPTGCVPVVPAGNILTNPGFNDGSFSGWNPGGYGGFSNVITDVAPQCGAYSALFTLTSSSSYGRIGQRFTTIDKNTRYQIRTYAKFVSGNPANCFYYLSCQLPGSTSSAGNPRLDTPLSSIPGQWTEYSLTCPLGANQLAMSLTIQCNQGSGPVVIGIDEVAMYPVS